MRRGSHRNTTRGGGGHCPSVFFFELLLGFADLSGLKMSEFLLLLAFGSHRSCCLFLQNKTLIVFYQVTKVYGDGSDA